MAKKISKTMGNYCSVILFDSAVNEWKGVIWEGSTCCGTNYIYKNFDKNLDVIISMIDERLCFYNNKDLELINKHLPTGWHLGGSGNE